MSIGWIGIFFIYKAGIKTKEVFLMNKDIKNEKFYIFIKLVIKAKSLNII
ncbi:hypothetical protein MPAN_005690 [Mariniplasma anaerobium]|uniref:Uncharacterized protein n=1 Tax=Mariniplasma anaerobium TaxID=2735436 RepID=A0A7U9XUG1_9MOLU|nr:hypothetical protein MPAN_005690 [Mariniplasma anaerobium]